MTTVINLSNIDLESNGLTPEELERAQRELLRRAVAIILSPNWGKSKRAQSNVNPIQFQGKGSGDNDPLSITEPDKT